MHWIDGHLDLAYLALRGRDIRKPYDGPDGCVSLPALREGGVSLCFGTIYTEPGQTGGEPWGYPTSDDVEAAHCAGVRQIEVYEQLETEGEIAIVRRPADLDRDDGRIKVVVLMEGADPIRSPEEARWWFDRGVRFVGLTWAMGTRYAGGNAKPGGLTSIGRELVAALDGLAIAHDASHLADAAFDDLLSCARGQIVATHSNCRTLLSNNQRHLRDDQIKEITSRGGIIGLNLFSMFLVNDGRATVADAVRHIEHVCATAGHRSCVALGSDMDGGFGPNDLPMGLDHPRNLNALADALAEAGWSDDDIAGFAHGNWLRFLRDVMR